MSGDDDAHNVSVRALERFALDVLLQIGVPEENARAFAKALIYADLRGIGSHGVSRLPVYALRLEKGLMNGNTRGRILRRSPAVIAIDGENGIGQVLGARAMVEAVNLAASSGAAVAGVQRSNHFGAAGYFCELAADRGMIGLAFTNSPKGIPPWGGRQAYFGTNPIAAAIPVPGRPHVVIDLSTSVTARGNIILAAKTGSPIPEGWAIDADGNPTTDPEKALEGAVLPMAGPKGYALALMVEILAGVLTGAAYGPGVRNMYQDWSAGSDVGHLMIALDPDAFGGREVFARRMAKMAGEVEAVPPLPGKNGPRLPGARRHELAEKHRKEGIRLHQAVLDDLDQLARRLNVPGVAL